MSAARQARKTVTILFCDLVHSTGLAEGDPEAYRRTQERFFDAMRPIVEQHGGTVEKFIGDEVMAVFGVPVAHEDDALRAVRAAQVMQEAVAEIGLEATIGINTGEVVASDPASGDSFVSGEPVIVAKRLEQGAEAGEIVIGKATYPLVSHAISAGPLERIPAKGKREEIGRHLVEKVDRDAPAFVRRLDALMVDRELELELLKDAFERAVQEKECRLFTVLGEPGIGKSRLAAELCAVVGERTTTATGRCLPYGAGITFWPLTEIVRGVGGEDALRESLRGDERAEDILRLIWGLTGTSDTPGSADEAFWAVRRAFEALARQRPVVLCLDDLHWAEPTLLELIEYVAGMCRNAPLLLVCLSRPELVEQRPTWIAPQPHMDALALEPLSTADAGKLLAGLSDDLPAELSDRIASAAEGNPLFLEQMAVMAAEDGQGELAVPPSIQALLAERLDRLTPGEREVLERASIVGREFSFASVSGLSEDDQRAALPGHLLSLARKVLVHADPSAGEDRFRFHHVLVRDGAYAAIPKDRRAYLHERMADWVGSHYPERRLEEVVGYHLEQSHRLRAEIGPPDEYTETLARRAADALAVAGRRALTRDDIPAAVSFLQRAATLLLSDPAERCEVLVDLASALREGGDLAQAEEILAEAAKLAGERGRDEVRLRARVASSLLRATVDSRVEAGDMLRIAEEAISFFETTGDDLGLAEAFNLVAHAHWMRCRCADVEQTLERALAHAERAGAVHEANAIRGGLIRAALTGPRPVEDAIQRCLSIREASVPGPVLDAFRDSILAVLESMRGRFDKARRLSARSKTTAEDVGVLLLPASLSMYIGIAELIAGNYDAAERVLSSGSEQYEQMGETSALSTMAAFRARALYGLERFDEAERATRKSEASASPDDVASQMILRGTRARLLARQGDPRAEEVAREAVRLARETDFTNWRADALVHLAETLDLLGRGDEAAPLIEEALSLYEAKGNVASAAIVRQTGRLTPRKET